MMKLNRKTIRKMILKEMSDMMQGTGALTGNENYEDAYVNLVRKGGLFDVAFNELKAMAMYNQMKPNYVLKSLQTFMMLKEQFHQGVIHAREVINFLMKDQFVKKYANPRSTGKLAFALKDLIAALQVVEQLEGPVL